MTTWHTDLLYDYALVAALHRLARSTGDVYRIAWVDGSYTYCTPDMVRFEETR